MTAPKDWLHPPRLRLPFMIRGRAIQTVSPGKQVRGLTQRYLPTQQLLAWFQPWGLACSYLSNKSRVLWMIVEWQRPGKIPLLINISSWNFGPQMYRTCGSLRWLSAETTKLGTSNTFKKLLQLFFLPPCELFPPTKKNAFVAVIFSTWSWYDINIDLVCMHGYNLRLTFMILYLLNSTS